MNNIPLQVYTLLIILGIFYLLNAQFLQFSIINLKWIYENQLQKQSMEANSLKGATGCPHWLVHVDTS